MRRINVNDEIYLWRRGHYHLTEFKHSKCAEKVVIYLEGFKNSPIHLSFKEEDNLIFKDDIEKEKWCVGYPDNGVIWLLDLSRPDNVPPPAHIDINLNRPAVIAILIKYFIQNGWNPKETTRPLIIEDALKFLDILELPKGAN